MAQPAPQVPNAATMQTAINGMNTEENNIVQSLQAYSGHRQQLHNQMTLATNFPVAQIQQQLAALQQQLATFQLTVQQGFATTNAE